MSKRPIATAMALSVAIHAGLFALVDWMISNQAERAPTATELLLRLRAAPQSLGEDSDADRTADTTIAPSPETLTPLVSSHPAGRAGPTSDPLQADDPAGNGIHAEAVQNSAAPPITEADLATTVAESAPVQNTSEESRESLEAPLSASQLDMLQRKFADAAYNLRGIADLTNAISWSHEGRDYVAEAVFKPAAHDMDLDRLRFEIRTEHSGSRYSTELTMRRLSFSNYAQFINAWDPSVQIHDDELDGRFHSNSEISLSYNRKVQPLFHGRVTTSARNVKFDNQRGYFRRDEIFLGGLQTGVKSIRLPNRFVPFPSTSDIDRDQVRRFEGDARITFYGDGRYAWQVLEADSKTNTDILSSKSTYLIAGNKAKLYVQGTVNGKVLVYSPTRIVIEGDLVYADDPESVPDSDDYLGLVSDRYVDIAPPSVTGPGDLSIHAAIYAKRRFAVRRYRSSGNALLTIYGSLTAGSLSATEPRYATRIRFDPRLETLRPPAFPMTNRYELEPASGVWAVEPILD